LHLAKSLILVLILFITFIYHCLKFSYSDITHIRPSVHQHCSLGDKNGIWPVKDVAPTISKGSSSGDLQDLT